MIFLALLIWTIADSLSNDPATEVIAVRIIVIILVFIMLILFMISTKKVKRCFEQLIILIVLCGVTLKLVTEYINGSDGSMVSAMIPITTIVIIDIGTYKMFIINLIYNIVYFIRILIFYSLEIDTVNVVIIGMNYIALLTGITIVCGFVGYVMERARREEYVLIKALDFQLSRT